MKCKRILMFASAVAIAVGIPVQAQIVTPQIMTWPDLLGRVQPQPDQTLAYGPDVHQVVDLWLPRQSGRHPTVVMLHGGCWQTKIADRKYMNWIAADLRSRGIAVWNIDYRGVDVAGGGYPGTFADVATAADLLAEVAPKYHLSLRRVVAVGHSAGGQLAMWLAARPGLPRTSVFQAAHPLALTAVVSLGGLPDLEAATTPPKGTCRASSALQLVGAPTPSHPDVFVDTSPAAMPVWQAQTTMINGELDPIAPPAFATAFAARMALRGKIIDRVTVAKSAHVELVTPETPAWHQAAAIIEQALQNPRAQ